MTAAPPTRSIVLRTTVAGAAMPLVAALTAPLIARALGADGRGALAAVLTPLTLADAVGSLGLPVAATYFVARGVTPRRFMALAVPYLLASWVVTYAILASLATSVARNHGLDIGFILTVWASTGVLLLLNLMRAFRIAQEEWSRVNWERVAGPCLRLGLIAALFWLGWATVETVTWTYIGTVVVAGLVLIPRARGGWHSPAEQVVTAKEIQRYSTRSWATTLVAAMHARIDQLLLVFLVSSAALGTYAVAVTIAELPLILAVAVYRVSFTRVAKGQDWAATFRQSRLTTAATLALSAGLTAAAIPAVPLIFGEAFADARWLAALLMLATVLLAPVNVINAALNGIGRPAQAAVPLLTALVLDAILVVTLTPPLGVLGAAVAAVGAAIGGFAVGLRILRRLKVPATTRGLLLPSWAEVRGLMHRSPRPSGAAPVPSADQTTGSQA